jgi:hypothetical protein
MLRKCQEWFGEMQAAVKNGHVLSKRGGREGKESKFPRIAQKVQQQAHTNRLLHTLAEAQHELNMQNKEVAELKLINKARAGGLLDGGEIARRSMRKQDNDETTTVVCAQGYTASPEYT